MSIEQPAEFTNSSLEDAADAYEPDPTKVSGAIYTARLLDCDSCPMQRDGKCVAGGLCCNGSVVLAARKPEARSAWYLCGWLNS